MTNKEATAFQFPVYYNKEPFFTVQPVLDTRKKQFQMWRDLILQYCSSLKIYELDLLESIKSNSILFFNQKINRRLSIESLKLIIQDIVDNGYAEWLDKDKSRVLILWRKPEEWASLLYKWVSDCGLANSILTVWEIQNGDDSKSQEFYQLNTAVLMKSLKALEKQNKAQIFSSNGDDSNLGVKFFSV
ncbi:hypothetical protein CYY_005687 [Polysphondylium violaceum]|uniref:Vacuolar protein-sorting-associated protein 25 n=1 Tax=Polysphondylium violaceum TaxID=133409 RepID=A0A8J4PUP2_9MYCE|nr:hypothetical protein CYY_005687 [Polysphondylium violaceum]